MWTKTPNRKYAGRALYESSRTEPQPNRAIIRAGGPLENRDVRDISGDQPEYIGEQEFYANHVKQGGAVLIVHPTSEQSANRAAEILRAQARGPQDAGRTCDPRVA